MMQPTLRALVVCTGMVLASCRDTPDLQPTLDQTLRTHRFDSVIARHDRTARVVVLQGDVETDGDRQRAEAIIHPLVAAPITLRNEIRVAVHSKATTEINDGVLLGRVTALADQDPVMRIRQLAFDVNNAVVTVSGRLGTTAERRRLNRQLHAVEGVRDVVDRTTLPARVSAKAATASKRTRG